MRAQKNVFITFIISSTEGLCPLSVLFCYKCFHLFVGLQYLQDITIPTHISTHLCAETPPIVF